MKKFFLLIALILIPVGMFATTTKDLAKLKMSQPKKHIPNVEVFKGNITASKNIFSDGQSLTAVNKAFCLDTLEIMQEMFSYESTPAYYEPISGVLAYTYVDYTFPSATESYLQTNHILRYSIDDGQSWSNKEVFFTHGPADEYTQDRYSSLAITNPTGITDKGRARELDYHIYSTFWGLAIDPQYISFQDGFYLHGQLSNLSGVTNFQQSLFSSDETYESQLERGLSLSSAAYSSNASSKQDERAYFYGLLSPYDDNYNNGYYGLYYFLKSTEVEEESKVAPFSWSLRDFLPSPTPTTTMYTSRMSLDIVPSGKMFAMFNNMYNSTVDRKNAFRRPGASVSEDKGLTWTDCEVAPENMCHVFAANFSNGVTPAGTYDSLYMPFAYNGQAGIAYGEDEYSFITPIRLKKITATDTNISNPLYVEFHKKGSSWDIKKVVDSVIEQEYISAETIAANRSGFLIGIDFPVFEKARSAANVDTLFTSYRDNNFQLSKTADGQYLVCAWVGLRPDSVKLTTPVQVRYNSTASLRPFTYFPTTDIFMSFRKIGDGEQWSNPINVTNDSLYEHTMTMPKIIKDIYNVPIFYTSKNFSWVYTETLNNGNPNPYFYRNSLPKYMSQMYVDDQTTYFCKTVDYRTVVDAVTDPKPVVHSSFSLSEPTPNPAENNAEITFSTDEVSNVHVAVYNSMGQLVSVLYNGTMYPGTLSQNFNTSNLSSGAYYVTFVNGKNSVTKLLNVIK